VEKGEKNSYSFRIEHPPPVPVTQPNVQNLAHSDGMRLAGWAWSLDVTRWSLLSLDSVALATTPAFLDSPLSVMLERMRAQHAAEPLSNAGQGVRVKQDNVAFARRAR
jgi:hypothetical protein